MPAAPTISPLSDAERQRRRRERLRTGARTFKGELPADVVERLVELGRLSEAEANDPNQLGDVLEDIADCLVRGTLTCMPLR